MHEFTSSTVFSNLTMKNHQGVIDRFIMRKRQTLPTKSPNGKELRQQHFSETIDEASTLINSVDDNDKILQLYESTRQVCFPVLVHTFLTFLALFEPHGFKNYGRNRIWNVEWWPTFFQSFPTLKAMFHWYCSLYNSVRLLSFRCITILSILWAKKITNSTISAKNSVKLFHKFLK